MVTIVIILFLFFAMVISFVIYEQKRLNRLKENYENALKGTDKKAALDAGRAYYSSLRKGTLTIYDEQAITNDLSTMN